MGKPKLHFSIKIDPRKLHFSVSSGGKSMGATLCVAPVGGKVVVHALLDRRQLHVVAIEVAQVLVVARHGLVVLALKFHLHALALDAMGGKHSRSRTLASVMLHTVPVGLWPVSVSPMMASMARSGSGK